MLLLKALVEAGGVDGLVVVVEPFVECALVLVLPLIAEEDVCVEPKPTDQMETD